MRLYACQHCGQHVYFENVRCVRCGHTLGFLPDRMEVSALEGTAQGLWRALASPEDAIYRACANSAQYEVCNWMIPERDPDPLCVSCRLNRTIPDLTVAGNQTLWQRLETQKRRLVYSLLRLDLPVQPRHRDPKGMAFDFLADPDPAFNEQQRVLTGHADGLITLNIAEADPAAREQMRKDMAEPYRTLLGHFRHESGHYYWDRLVRDREWLSDFRSLFGDETLDYRQALQRHHAEGPPRGWRERFVTAYASSHPWEDWAETWAHYLHIVDTLETARAFGVDVRLKGTGQQSMAKEHGFDPCSQTEFAPILENWLPLAFALNSLNRSMGHEDAYPFVLAPPAVEKLQLVHRIIRHQSVR
ncbi:putative zinc-binding metallopeptidase [Thioalkalivibrio sp.]|uniref:zinc-binding metallopeptidase family protein n=1 Tax=Thioalkalivibrio sp. TaxID=2093813 RepID=UPI00356945B9